MNDEPPRDPFSAGAEDEGAAVAEGSELADAGQVQRPSVPRPEPRSIPYARAHAPASTPSKRKGTIPGAASAPPSPLAPSERSYEEAIPRAAPLPRLPEVDQFVARASADGAPPPDHDERRRRSRRTVKLADEPPVTTPSPSAPVAERAPSAAPGLRGDTPAAISAPPPEVRDDDWVSPEPPAAALESPAMAESERITPDAPPVELAAPARSDVRPMSDTPSPLARPTVPRPIPKPISVPRPLAPATTELAAVGFVADPDAVGVIRPLQIMSDLPPVSSAIEPEPISAESYPDEYEVAALPLRFLSDGPTPLDPAAELQAEYQEIEPESAPEEEEQEAEADDDEGEGPPTAPDWRSQQSEAEAAAGEQTWGREAWETPSAPEAASEEIEARASLDEVEAEPIEEFEPEPRSDVEGFEELDPDRDSDAGEEIPVDMIDELEAPKKPPPPPPRRPAPASVDLPAYASPIPPAITPLPPTSTPAPPTSTPVPGAAEPARPPPPPPAAARAAAEPAGPISISDAARRKKAWWEDLFGDDFSRTLDRLEPRAVRREVDFIEERLGVEKTAVILDLACGAGAHAVEMASRGYSVVGYDLSLSMLARAADEAQERGQKLNFLQGDMREMAFEETFDAVYCWSTSFGYFDEEKNAEVLHRIHRGLRTGGLLLLDVINRDYVACRQPSLVWFEGDGCVCMDEMQIDFFTSRLKVKRTVMFEDGRSRELDYSIRLYGLHEIGKLMHEAGFKVTEVTGHPAHPGVFFGSESPRLIVLAERS